MKSVKWSLTPFLVGLVASSVMAAPPLVFIPNAGQTDGAVLFHVKSAGPEAFFTREGVVYREAPDARGHGSVIRMRVAGMREGVSVAPREPLGGRANFFLGRDPAGWRAGIPTWGGLEYVDALAGVDWVWSGRNGTLKSDLIVAPGVDPSSITLIIEGAECVAIDADGALRIGTLQGEIIERPPVAWQRGRSEGPVTARFVMRGRDSVGFEIGPRDTQSELVIDPVMDFATFLGGSAQDGVSAVHGGMTTALAAGRTRSPDFPTSVGPYLTPAGNWDAFYVEMDLLRSSILESTFYGGSGDEGVVAVMGRGLTGNTSSPDLPLPRTSLDGTLGGATDGFVANWDSSRVTVAFYVGGSGDDEIRSASPLLVGVTSSRDFPLALGTMPPGWPTPYDSTLSGPTDGFVATYITGTFTNFLAATYLGGSGDDAVNTSGSAGGAGTFGVEWVAGQTSSADFPTSPSAHDRTLSGPSDAFVSAFPASAPNERLWQLGPSTFLGGSGGEAATDMLGAGLGGRIEVVGWTDSSDFPLVEPLAPGLAGGRDAFLSTLTPNASSLLFSTPIGGSLDEGPLVRLTMFLDHQTLVTTTASPDVPLRDPLQSSLRGPSDVLVATINLDSVPPRFEWATYLGGMDSDTLTAATKWPQQGCIVLGGSTVSSDFPMRRAIQPALAGGEDGFVARLCESDILGRRDPEDVLPEIQDQLDRIEDQLAACDCAAMQAALADLQSSAADAAADHALMQDALDDLSRRVDELLALLLALGKEPLEREIERALFARDCVPWLWLPAAQDGKLEVALALLARRIDAAVASGSPGVNESVARARFANATDAAADGDYQRACRSLVDTIHALTTP